MRRKRLCILLAVIAFTFAGCSKAPSGAAAQEAFVSFGTPSATVDFIDGRALNTEVLAMLSSLKAIVNRNGTRLYVAESEYDWVSDMGLTATVYDDPYELVAKYAAQIHGVVLYDKNNTATLDLAFAAASLDDLLVCSYLTYGVLAVNAVQLAVKEDYRNRFATAQAAYEYMYDVLWEKLSKNALAFLSVDMGGGVRDYLTATKTVTISLSSVHAPITEKFVSDLSDNATIFTDEPNAVSEFSLETVNVEGCENLMFFSGLGKSYERKPSVPMLQNKVYVSIVLSYEHNFSALFDSVRTDALAVATTEPLTFALHALSESVFPALYNWHVWAYDNRMFVPESIAEQQVAQNTLPILLDEKLYIFNKYNKYIPIFLTVKLDAARTDFEALNMFMEQTSVTYGKQVEFVSYAAMQALQAKSEVKL